MQNCRCNTKSNAAISWALTPASKKGTYLTLAHFAFRSRFALVSYKISNQWKLSFCFQFKSDAHPWDTWVSRADSDSPGSRQGGSQISEYVLLSEGTQTFSPTASSLSAQSLLLCSHMWRNRDHSCILLYPLLHLLLDWYLSSRLLCWGLMESLHDRNSFPDSDSVVFPCIHEVCPSSLEVNWIVLYLISCHPPV